MGGEFRRASAMSIRVKEDTYKVHVKGCYDTFRGATTLNVTRPTTLTISSTGAEGHRPGYEHAALKVVMKPAPRTRGGGGAQASNEGESECSLATCEEGDPPCCEGFVCKVSPGQMKAWSIASARPGSRLDVSTLQPRAHKTLRELGRTHAMIVQDVVRVQSWIKALTERSETHGAPTRRGEAPSSQRFRLTADPFAA